MSFNGHYRDSVAEGKTEQSPNWRDETRWQVLADVVDRLKRRVETAYYHCDEDAADEAHEQLLCAEWRLRQAEKRRNG